MGVTYDLPEEHELDAFGNIVVNKGAIEPIVEVATFEEQVPVKKPKKPNKK